ncbi:MAG: hypothetical protein COB02_02065 [Candidatus Cloacimonadota bacterium]|nr:MAG: hypothetical protein COB02_02065 [Candidatus Cloacimonadota bacterium]
MIKKKIFIFLQYRKKYFGIGLLLAIFFGFFGLQIQIEDVLRLSNSIEPIKVILNETNKYPSLGTITPGAISQLSDIRYYKYKFNLPRVTDYPLEDLTLLNQLGKKCQIKKLKLYTDSYDWKYDFSQWLLYKCNHQEYEKPLYFKAHPFGYSYAYLKFLDLSKEKKKKFVWKNIEDFHLKELEKIQIELPFLYKIWKHVGTNTWLSLVDFSSIVILNDYILIPVNKNELARNKVYQIYNRKKYLVYIEDILYEKGMQPFLPKNDYYSVKSFYISWFFQLLSIVIFLIIILLFIYQKYIKFFFKKKLEQQKLIVLQGLTHELRSPITAIKLSLEPFRTEYKTLNIALQKSFLNLSISVEKCFHIIYASHDFLSALNLKSSVINFSNIDSIEKFIQENFDFEDNNFSFECLEDFNLRTDEKWLIICLNNLIDNAFKYGKAPIILRVEIKRKQKIISIIDQGNLLNLDITKLLEPFYRNDNPKHKQESLGLGLSLVHNLSSQIGAKLMVHQDPSTFQLIWIKDD